MTVDLGTEYDNSVTRITMSGALTASTAATARELLVDACELATVAVVLDLTAVVGLEDPELLRHLVDVAQRRCWAARRRLDVTATDPDICAALATLGVWPLKPGARTIGSTASHAATA